MGRVFNVLGEPIDDATGIQQGTLAYSSTGTALDEQETREEIFKTGIKVVDLLSPYPRGGKIDQGGAGVGKTVLIMEFVILQPSAKGYSVFEDR